MVEVCGIDVVALTRFKMIFESSATASTTRRFLLFMNVNFFLLFDVFMLWFLMWVCVVIDVLDLYFFICVYLIVLVASAFVVLSAILILSRASRFYVRYILDVFFVVSMFVVGCMCVFMIVVVCLWRDMLYNFFKMFGWFCVARATTTFSFFDVKSTRTSSSFCVKLFWIIILFVSVKFIVCLNVIDLWWEIIGWCVLSGCVVFMLESVYTWISFASSASMMAWSYKLLFVLFVFN